MIKIACIFALFAISFNAIAQPGKEIWGKFSKGKSDNRSTPEAKKSQKKHQTLELAPDFEFEEYVDKHNGVIPFDFVAKVTEEYPENVRSNGSYFSEDIEEGGFMHYYLMINPITECELESENAFEFLRSNINQIFPGGANDMTTKNHANDKIELNHTYQLKRDYGFFGIYVTCTEISSYHFTFTANKDHILSGTAIHGVFKDNTGKLFLFQQGQGVEGEWAPASKASRLLANHMMWRQMADNFKRAIAGKCAAQPLIEDKITGRFHIGQKYGGGIIFYVDETGQHGLISAIKDQSPAEDSKNWKDANDLANTYKDPGNHRGWRLPTAKELLLLYEARNIVGGFGHKVYWSSSISRSSDNKLTVQFVNGNENGTGTPMYVKLNVRAIREF